MKRISSALAICSAIFVITTTSAIAADEPLPLPQPPVKKDQLYTEEIIHVLCTRSRSLKWREGCVASETAKMKRGESMGGFDRRMYNYLMEKRIKRKAAKEAKKAVEPVKP